MIREHVRFSGYSISLAGVIFIAILVRVRLLFGTPFSPGADYGHTLLFADQIRKLGEIPSVFPFHQLGLTNFHSSPGLPLEMLALDWTTDLSPLRLPGFALVFSLVGVVGIYLLGRTLTGPGPGLMAALVYATLPANLEILGWAGYANIYALSLTPFFWWALIRARQDPRHLSVWLAALLVSAIALVHPLTTLFVGAATLLTVALDLATARDRAWLLKVYVYLLGATSLLSLPMLAHALRNYVSEGDSLGFWSVDLASVTRLNAEDYLYFFSALGIAFAVIGLPGLVARRFERPLTLWLIMFFLLVSVAAAYSWIAGIGFYYERALYFIALPVSLFAGYAIWSVQWPMGRCTLIAVAAGAMSLAAMETAPKVAEYYSLLDEDSLGAMEWVRENSSPDDVVVTDGCLGFLWAYIGQRPTAAAFSVIYLSSSVEEAVAADARLILQDPAAAQELLTDYQVRYVMYDSDCGTFNPTVVLNNLKYQPSLKQVAVFGSIYVYQSLD